MHQQMGQFQDELKKMEDKLQATEEERDRAVAELRAMKKMADEEANKRKRENSTKEMLSEGKEELKTKEKIISSLKLQLQKSKEMELSFSEKDISLNTLKDQLAIAKSSESNAAALSSEREKQIHELEAELEKGKKAEAKMFDSLINQTEQLEETRVLLQESKTQIQSLLQKVEKLENSQNDRDDSELQLAKQNLSDAEIAEKLAWKKAKILVEEMHSMKSELKAANEAEENSKKALDDLALALKEVATEANQVKEKLGLAQAELDHSRGEEDRLSLILKSTEEKFKALLDEARKESELYKNTAERLRSEAEETLVAWNGKETGLVNCIKRAEEESVRLQELLNEAEKQWIASKEENNKLRDILKQALNEANAAKIASGIAKEENSQLKDTLAEKDRNLNFLTQENENFRVNEVAALENIKELKRLLCEATAMKEDYNNYNNNNSNNDNNREEKLEKPHLKDSKEKTHTKELKKEPDQKDKVKASNLVDKEEKESGGYKLSKTISLNLSEALMKGSLFGYANKPSSEVIDHHHDNGHLQRNKSTALACEEDTTEHDSDHDSDHENTNNPDENHSDHDHDHDHDAENERSNRKKKALIWRFGDLLKKKSTHGHRKEPSFE